MSTRVAPRIRFDGALMAEDLALKGWRAIDLANKARVSDMTVYRFLDGRSQSAPIAKRLAVALGYKDARRYLISSRTTERVA